MPRKTPKNVALNETSMLTTPRPGHFFAASIAEWKVSNDPGTLVNHFKREKYSFLLWFVPTTIDAEYAIAMFAPQVDGATVVAAYEVPKS